MSESQDQFAVARERRRAEWTERLDRFARKAAPQTRPFAEALVSIVQPPVGARVLDVATGTGLVAVEAARHVGSNGTVLATDFLPAWEPYVHDTAATAGVRNVTFATMAAEVLDLPDASFDVVYCQFGLMFVPEPVQALHEMRRVLLPGGHLGIAVWSVPEKVGIFIMARIVGPAFPPPAGEAPPSPMSMGAPGLIERLVAEAGFQNVVVHHVTRFYEVVDPEAEWQSWIEEFKTPEGQTLEDLPRQEQRRLHDEVIAALGAFRTGDVVRISSEAIIVTATR